MKKIFTSALFLSAMLAANAQSAFVATSDFDKNLNDGNGDMVSCLGIRMSANGQWVAGQEQNMAVPFVWNVGDNVLSYVIKTDSQVIDPSEWGGEEDPYTETYVRNGSFNSVSNAGLAVGSYTDQITYQSSPIVFDPMTERVMVLSIPADAEGGDAYGITDNAKTIVGFWFDENWTTHGCVWDGAQKKRIDLPWPTEEESGMKIDYATARYISADGSVVLGYVQDFYSGDYVMVVWNRQQDGTYVVNADFAKENYQEEPYTEIEGEDGWPVVVYDEIKDPKKYTTIEPLAISDNGEWVVAVVADYTEEDDWNFFAADKALRLNLVTGESQEFELKEEGEGMKIEFFGIANDGTCVGRYTGAFDWETFSQTTDAVLWPVGAEDFVKMSEIFEGDPYLEDKAASAFSYISGDGAKVMGYAGDEMGTMTTFVATLPEQYVGVNAVKAATTDAKVIYDLQGRRVENAAKGLYIVNGTKVIR